MYILNAPSYFQNGVSETGAELHVPPIDEPCPLQSPKHLMDLGQGLVNGIVHKVEGTIVDMFKGGTPTLTKFQANKVFKVTVRNLGMAVTDLFNGTSGSSNTGNDNGSLIGLGIAAASWIIVIVGAAQSTGMVQPPLVTPNSNIGNGLEQTKRQGGVAKGLIVGLVEDDR